MQRIPEETRADGAKAPCSPDALVCHCHRVTVGEVRTAIEQGGAKSVEDLSAQTKAGTGCRGCHCKLNRMLCGLPPNCGRFGYCGRCGCVQVLCGCDAA